MIAIYFYIYLELQVGYFLGELGHALRVLGVAYLGHQQILPQLALQLSKLSLRLSEIVKSIPALLLQCAACEMWWLVTAT